MGFVDFCGDDVANQVDSTRANHSIFSKRDMQPLQYIKRAAPTWAARLIFRNFDFTLQCSWKDLALQEHSPAPRAGRGVTVRL